MVDETGELATTYRGALHGRLYPKPWPGMTGASSMVRRLCAFDLLLDIDMVNAMPTTIAELCRRLFIPADALFAYVRDRQRYLRLHPKMKHIVIVILNGGNYLKETDGRSFDFLEQLQEEVRDHIVPTLRRAFPALWAHAEAVVQEKKEKEGKTGAPSGNVAGVFMSKLYFAYERFIIDTARVVLDGLGWETCAVVFDGLMVRRKKDRPDLVPDLDALSDKVHDHTGFPVRFALKSLKPTKDDLDVLNASDPARLPVLKSGSSRVRPEKRVQRLEFRPGLKVLAVQAHMNGGKSYRTEECIQRDKPTRILIVCPRVSLSYAQWAQLKKHGFVHYKNSTRKELLAADRVIIQTESLHKLVADGISLSTFDLVILDEARSVFQQMVSPTHGDKGQLNFKIFKALLTNAKRVLLLDADLLFDGMVDDFLARNFAYDQVHFEVYPAVNLNRTYTPFSDGDWLRELKKDLRTAIRDGKKIGITYESKRTMDNHMKILSAELPGLRFAAISKDTEDRVAQKIFEDPDAFVNDLHLFAFTSKISVGVNILQPFLRVFAHVSKLTGPHARTIGQMIGRFRNLTNENIPHTFPLTKLGTPPPLSVDELQENFEQQGQLRRDAIRAMDIKVEDGKLQVTPTDRSRIIAHAVAERDGCLVASLVRQYARLGWRLVRRKRAGGKSLEEKRQQDKTKAELLKFQRETAAAVIDMSSDERITELGELHQRHDLSTEEEVRKDILRAAIRFRADPTSVDHLLLAAKNLDTFRSYLVFQTLAFQQDTLLLQAEEFWNVNEANIPEIAKMPVAAAKKLREGLRQAGFFEQKYVPGSELEAKKLELKQLFSESAELFRTSAGKPKNLKLKENVSVLRYMERALSNFGLKLSSKRVDKIVRGKRTQSRKYTLSAHKDIATIKPLLSAEVW